MYTKKRFSLRDMIVWTRFETYWFIAISLAEVLLFILFDSRWLQIPFTPIALIGTAVAFVIGFQNNAAYNRIWEARQIWGGIVNASRSFGIMVQDMISNEHAKETSSDSQLYEIRKTLIHRHIAWLTALRHAMRQHRPWEYVMDQKTNREWSTMIHVPELITKMEDELNMYLSPGEMQYIAGKQNKQTAILYLQSAHLKSLKEKKLIGEFAFLKIEDVVQQLFDFQGRSERIKNFPYPRQFATLMHYFTWVFIILLPLGITPQFAEISSKLATLFPVCSKYFVWMSVPFCVVVMWIFHTMNRIGSVGENPFESSTNDVPISTIARSIEIDLRQNLGEPDTDIPLQFPVRRDVQM